MLNFDRRFTWLPTLIFLCATGFTCTAQTPAPTPAAKTKSGPESCDGALDIVPSKSATFMRKRRPVNKKPAHKPENKSERNAAS